MNEKSSYLKYWDIINLQSRAISQKIPVYYFDCIKDTFQFNEDFIESYNDEINEGYIL